MTTPPVSLLFVIVACRLSSASRALCLLLALAMLASPSARAQTGVWSLRVLPPLSNAQMVYDSHRDVTVLFGGQSGGRSCGETWERVGTQWVQRPVPGPSPRYSHAMAYDSVRHVTVLFGGQVLGGTSGETWEWDGSSWTQRLVAGPSPRLDHAMAFDSRRGVTVLYGGSLNSSNNSLDSQTWEWNGTTWTQRMVTGTSGRFRHAMAFDAARGIIVLSGGATGVPFGDSTTSRDTWEFNGNIWVRRSQIGPAARLSHEIEYDPSRQRTVLFGGRDSGGTLRNDTWEWDGFTWVQIAGAGPFPRMEHAMAYDAHRGAMVIFGGVGTNTTGQGGDTWERQGDLWTQTSNSGPRSRYEHAAAYDSTRGVTVLFGGTYEGIIRDGETWEWNGADWNLRASTGPAPRMYHAMAFDSLRAVTVLFGGTRSAADGGYSGETWEWDGTLWSLRSSSGPAPRVNHAMAFDSRRQVTVLFGGTLLSGSTRMSDTWEWDGLSWSLRTTDGPTPRAYSAISYDSTRGVTVLFGGSDGARNGETWEWDGNLWTLRSTSGPSPRTSASMDYDSSRGVSVLFGGATSSSAYSNEIWEWDGIVWTQKAMVTPMGRTDASMSFDSARGTMVLLGGFGTSVDGGATWVMSTAPRISTQPESQSVCLAATPLFSVSAGGSQPLTYQWQWRSTDNSWLNINEGDNPAPDASATTFTALNTTTSTMSLHRAAGPSVLNSHLDIRCVVSNPFGAATSNPAALNICPADFDCDGSVDFFDYDAFVTCFEGTSCPPGLTADFDGDGAADFFDYDAFVTAFESPC